MFYAMIPLASMIIIGGFIYLKNIVERSYAKLDLVSVAIYTLGFGNLLYGFNREGSAGWLSTEVLLSFGVGILSLGLFTWRQLMSLDLRAFKYKMFSLTTIINMVDTIVMHADMILLPLYLQNAPDTPPWSPSFCYFPVIERDSCLFSYVLSGFVNLQLTVARIVHKKSLSCFTWYHHQ